jgi:ribosome-binding protein aMBF1 (putative translation factor)
LGIAQRHVQVSRAHIPTDRFPPKPLPTSIQTIGDAIHVKRREKGLNRWRLAYKMGIATLTVRDWEHNTSQPDQEQLTRLEKILGFKSDAILPKPPH